MNFIQAIEALQEGKLVYRKSYEFNHWWSSNACDDWEIYEDTKLYKLAEVLTAFNEGKTIARIGSDNSFDGSNMDRLLSLRDVVANDWIIL